MSTTDPSSRTPPVPPHILEAVYHHLPSLVVILSIDGIVQLANPAAERITGYPESELCGKNFWATLFPGRLFQQVPRFISPLQPAALLNSDIVMVLRTKTGAQRVLSWSRAITGFGSEVHGMQRSIVCFGVDITDRLNAADIDSPASREATTPFAAADLSAIEGECITPLAISPPILPSDANGNGPAAIQQVHDFLVGIEEHIHALETAFFSGEMQHLAGIADSLRTGAHACGLLDFSKRAELLHNAAANGALDRVSSLVQQIISMVRPQPET